MEEDKDLANNKETEQTKDQEMTDAKNDAENNENEEKEKEKEKSDEPKSPSNSGSPNEDN
jgi:hypothetical protein